MHIRVRAAVMRRQGLLTQIELDDRRSLKEREARGTGIRRVEYWVLHNCM